jgi:hypothetical protein
MDICIYTHKNLICSVVLYDLFKKNGFQFQIENEIFTSNVYSFSSTQSLGKKRFPSSCSTMELN